jgi:L-seryl-tRNA(Ser) seleniumtransferase
MRVDKLTYAALEATLEEFVAGRAQTTVPVAMMLAMPTEEIARRAHELAAALSSRGIRATVLDGESTIGGGSAPGTTLPTKLIVVEHPSHSANDIELLLRRQPVPIIARIEHDHIALDLRTVEPEDDALLLTAFDSQAT